MVTEIWINDNTEKLTAADLMRMVNDRQVQIKGFWTHTKASESYVIASFGDDGVWVDWYLPYVYRRTNVFIDSVSELVSYVRLCKKRLTNLRIEDFVRTMRRQAHHLFGSHSTVTLPIFKVLLNNCGKWVWNKKFSSSNPQRRIQELKERGFTLATKIEDKKTYHMLLPFDCVKAPTYETIPSKVRKAIFAALENLDAYNNRCVDRSALPDHKFPEIRWSADTAESNQGLTPEEMRSKFQLVPESINQAKREVCRKCFQTGKRGLFVGIKFFYAGNENWPPKIPMTGAAAEVGCEGCFWYDMARWRMALNSLIERK